MSDDLILTDDEKQALAEQQPQLTKFQRAQIMARRAAQAFMESNPGFYASSSNLELLCDWCIKMGLDPTLDNFDKAFVVLQDALEQPDRDAPPAPKALTAADVDRMSGEEFKRRLQQDKTFGAQVEALGAPEPSRWGMSRKRL